MTLYTISYTSQSQSLQVLEYSSIQQASAVKYNRFARSRETHHEVQGKAQKWSRYEARYQSNSESMRCIMRRPIQPPCPSAMPRPSHHPGCNPSCNRRRNPKRNASNPLTAVRTPMQPSSDPQPRDPNSTFPHQRRSRRAAYPSKATPFRLCRHARRS